MSGQEARAQVYADLAASTVFAAVRNYEPLPGALPKPLSCTVATAGPTAEDYRVFIRVYADTSTQANIEAAQDNLDAGIDEVETRLGVDYPRTEWTVEWSEPHQAFIATTTLPVPREDF